MSSRAPSPSTVTLIASTTENPYFYIYNALLSRCTVFEFKQLTRTDIEQGLHNAAQRISEEQGHPLEIEPEALRYLAQSAGGDMRKALGNMEFAIMRNNIYSLSVTNIAEIGDPFVDPTPNMPNESDEAYISINTVMEPWIVRYNDIEFK